MQPSGGGKADQAEVYPVEHGLILTRVPQRPGSTSPTQFQIFLHYGVTIADYPDQVWPFSSEPWTKGNELISVG